MSFLFNSAVRLSACNTSIAGRVGSGLEQNGPLQPLYTLFEGSRNDFLPLKINPESFLGKRVQNLVEFVGGMGGRLAVKSCLPHALCHGFSLLLFLSAMNKKERPSLERPRIQKDDKFLIGVCSVLAVLLVRELFTQGFFQVDVKPSLVNGFALQFSSTCFEYIGYKVAGSGMKAKDHILDTNNGLLAELFVRRLFKSVGIKPSLATKGLICASSWIGYYARKMGSLAQKKSSPS